jgi:hypothetical protein
MHEFAIQTGVFKGKQDILSSSQNLLFSKKKGTVRERE